MLVAFGLLAVVVRLNRVAISDVLHRTPNFGLMALAFVFYVSGMLLAYVRWSFYVQALGIPFQIRDGLRLGFIANLFNFIVPGGPLGGDVVRAAFLCREHAERKTHAIASVVLDRLVGLLALYLLACGAGTLAWAQLVPKVRRLVVVSWVVSGVVVLLLAIGFSPALYRPLGRLFAHRKKLARQLERLEAMGAAYRKRLDVVVLGLAMALLTHACNILAFYAASRALFSQIPSVAAHFLIVPQVLVTTAIPLPFGALGLSEGISGQLFKLAKYPNGAVAMLGFRVIQYASAVVSAFVYAFNVRQVRTLAETAKTFEDSEPAAP